MPDILMRNFLPVAIQKGPERLAFVALAGSVSTVLVSIAASGILLAVAILASGWILIQKGRSVLPIPPIALPLLIFFLWTVLTALTSAEINHNLMALKKFFIYLLLFLVPLVFRGPKALAWVYRSIFFFALCSSLRGIEQFIFRPNKDLLHRITGFMSHWMTFSGLLMLVLVALSAYALCYGWLKHKWIIPLGILCIVPLILSLTRNAWLGTITGILVVLALLRPRAIAGVALLLVVAYILLPASIRQRVRSGLDPNDPNTRNRIELFETAFRLIRDNPWVGVGQNSVKAAALRYRGGFEYPDWMYQHMHNNFIQIAAERGIPGLLLWLWFMLRLAWDAWRVYRADKRASLEHGGRIEKEALMASTAALGAWVALMIAGMAEYNLGDSEVLTLFLFMMSAPYVYLKNSAADGIDPCAPSIG